MVPPSIGSGWANTTAARGSVFGRSIRHSSGPIAPGISRITSANPSLRYVATTRLTEASDHACEFVRPCDQAKVAGALERHRGGMRPDARVFRGELRRHHAVESRLAGYHEH